MRDGEAAATPLLDAVVFPLPTAEGQERPTSASARLAAPKYYLKRENIFSFMSMNGEMRIELFYESAWSAVQEHQDDERERGGRNVATA